jgi:hypothetical protein
VKGKTTVISLSSWQQQVLSIKLISNYHTRVNHELPCRDDKRIHIFSLFSVNDIRMQFTMNSSIYIFMIMSILARMSMVFLLSKLYNFETLFHFSLDSPVVVHRVEWVVCMYIFFCLSCFLCHTVVHFRTL